MGRNVLLVEPNHKNKYPPMGLMKLSTYHKMMGDNVTFFKGELSRLVLEDVYQTLLKQLYLNNNKIFWEKYKTQICKYIKKGEDSMLDEIPVLNSSIIELLAHYNRYFKKKEYFKPENRKWDRVCISTLFTFYWDITVDTINFVKKLCKSETDVKVGGIIATVLQCELEKATGIKPISGLLDKPEMLDKNSKVIIDALPLDYSILEEIDYKYPAADSYFAYATRGCVNRCKFCSVWKLEPKYKSYVPICKQINIAGKKFGAKRNLLLLDNNVLASDKFDKIISDIKRAGFARKAKFNPPNLFEIAISNLNAGYNDRGYIRSIVRQYHDLINSYKPDKIQDVYDLLRAKFLLNPHTAKKDAIFATYENVRDLFEKFYRKKNSLACYVDFNQGIDARLVNDENMKSLFEVSIRPVRLAFDKWEQHKIYERAIRTAVKHGHKSLSNYILYNYEDKPVELYKRLKLNIDLSEELGVSIYSFPMKYHPIDNPMFFGNRSYIGTHWNRKFIRAVQAVLNAIKGKIGRGKSFFNEAFGADEKEFEKLLYMPETMIIYRMFFKNKGITDKWWNSLNKLNPRQQRVIKTIIHTNNFNDIDLLTGDAEILEVLNYYRINRSNAEKQMRGR
jgi:hypothetical protein